MAAVNQPSGRWAQRVVVLSLILLFFTIPHTLEDFATGEPAKAGVPESLLALVVSTIFFLQALGLYWLGKGRRWGVYLHMVIGLFWPIASGMAQLPAILTDAPYRSGAISILYVVGMILGGILLFLAAVMAMRE